MDKKLLDYVDRICERYLSFRPRTEREMRMYLKRKLAQKSTRRAQLDEDEIVKLIDDTLLKLITDNRIDDEAFVRWYVAEKNYFKPRGRIRLRHDLAALGINRDTISLVLDESEVTDESLITQLLETKYARVPLDEPDSREKLIQRLQRRGFSYGDIQSAIEEFTKKV